MFDWDRNNLRKIRARQISQTEVEEALRNDPVLAYEQDAAEEQARKIADRKGIGYQTLLKMLVREGLQREARRV